MMNNFSKELLLTWLKEGQELAQKGQLPHYISLLEQANPKSFSIYILRENKVIFQEGDLSSTFPLMSVIKPFLLFYLLVHLGEDTVFKKVGREPSAYSFNSLEQLQKDQGFPRNPMINSGAIMLSSLIEGENSQERCEILRKWLNKKANCQLFLDKNMLSSVQSKPNFKNQALLRELVTKNNLQNPNITLETYNAVCCLSGTIIDLAKLGLLLINQTDLSLSKYSKIVQEIMLTCGLYEASKAFSEKAKFPTKSGVSGLILSVIPEENMVFTCYSPPLDQQGNSILGMYLLENIGKILNHQL